MREAWNIMSFKILAIDDEQICLEIIEFALETRGYKVITVDNGNKALDVIKSNDKIDLILLDMMMPDIYGLDLLEQIQDYIISNNVPVILQTGTSNEEDIQIALSKGAVASIKKPYHRQELIDLIENTVKLEVI
jgi:two-component system sensor histidine kinase ChiS